MGRTVLRIQYVEFSPDDTPEMAAADRRDLWVHFAGCFLILYFPFIIYHRVVIRVGGPNFFRGLLSVFGLSLLWSLFRAWRVSVRRRRSRSFVTSQGPQVKSRLKVIGATGPMIQEIALDGSFFDPCVFNATIHLNVEHPHKTRYTKSRFILYNFVGPLSGLAMLVQLWTRDFMAIGKIAIVFLFTVYFVLAVHNIIRALQSSALRIAPGRIEFVTFPIFRRSANKKREIDVRGASVRVNLMDELLLVAPKSGGSMVLPLSAYGARAHELIESILMATTSKTIAPQLPDDQLIG